MAFNKEEFPSYEDENNDIIVLEQMDTTIREHAPEMIDEIFDNLSRDMHIIVCGPPRVGKSTLINAMCGRELAETREGLTPVTHDIKCYTIEGQCNTGSNIVRYEYNFWDTPGFESWDKDNIKTKIKEIFDKPETKPLCMIFCASPGTYVDLIRLDWLLDLCINKNHIFCALVCTNKYAGEMKSCRAVLEDFNKLLLKYTNDSPREENNIIYYGNIGLCTSVNSQPFECIDRILPISGVNEFIYGIMNSLVDEHVLNWCLIVLENEGFWNDCQVKFSGLLNDVKERTHIVKKFFNWKMKRTMKTEKIEL